VGGWGGAGCGGHCCLMLDVLINWAFDIEIDSLD